MLNQTRRLATTFVAALRDNPLVRYGSPARRLSVPRGIWWLAMGAALFFGVMVSLVDVGRQAGYDIDPYLVVLGVAAMAMPLVAAICFLGFGFPYREREHLAELELAGMTSRDLMVGFLYWPVVGCLLVVGALGITPWGAAIASLITKEVSQPVDVFAWRLAGWIALAPWAMVCLVIAFRAWSVPQRRGVVVVAVVLGAVAPHLFWILALQVRLVDALTHALDRFARGFATVFLVFLYAFTESWMRDLMTIVLAALTLLAMALLELWLTGRATWRLFAGEEQATPSWLAPESWPRVRRPSVEATTEWVLSALLAALAVMVSTRWLTGLGLAMAWHQYPYRQEMYLAGGGSALNLEPGIIVALVVVVSALLALYSLRWRLPDDARARRWLIVRMVCLLLFVAVGSLLYAALAEASLALDFSNFLERPWVIFSRWGGDLLRAYASTTLLVLVLPILVFVSIRGCRQSLLVGTAWIALAVFVVWPAHVEYDQWGDYNPTSILSWFPYMGRSGLWWFIVAVALCVWIKLRGVRAATPPRR